MVGIAELLRPDIVHYASDNDVESLCDFSEVESFTPEIVAGEFHDVVVSLMECKFF